MSGRKQREEREHRAARRAAAEAALVYLLTFPAVLAAPAPFEASATRFVDGDPPPRVIPFPSREASGPILRWSFVWMRPDLPA